MLYIFRLSYEILYFLQYSTGIMIDYVCVTHSRYKTNIKFVGFTHHYSYTASAVSLFIWCTWYFFLISRNEPCWEFVQWVSIEYFKRSLVCLFEYSSQWLEQIHVLINVKLSKSRISWNFDWKKNPWNATTYYSETLELFCQI